MKIRLNGEKREINEGVSLEWLLEELKIGKSSLAIEYNGEILEDEVDLSSIVLKAGDELEIVRYVGGG